ncbi:carbohydrate-binding module family 21 protein [Atractiella rhizophila]|nr:carbohydrate-binding module family 21 protein [Atractiella rhizophila]
MCHQVHLNPNPQEIKIFQYSDEPTVIGRTAVTEEQKKEEGIDHPSLPVEEENEWSTDDELDEGWLIRPHPINFTPFSSSKALDSEIYVETIELCSPTAFHDGPPTCLRGCVAVQNLALRKSVLIKWTVDSWKSYSEVLATSLRTIKGRAFEEFEFEIGLEEITRNAAAKDSGKWWERRLQFCVRFRCGNFELWDDNARQYYEVAFLRSQGRAEELESQNANVNRRRHHIRKTRSLSIPITELAPTTQAVAAEPSPDLCVPPTPRLLPRPLPRQFDLAHRSVH